MTEDFELSLSAAEALCLKACRGAGADDRSARSLTRATLSAAVSGPAALGFPHFIDYLESFRGGRINPQPAPTFEQPLPAFLTADADGGIAQLGFDLAYDTLVDAAKSCGIAIFTQGNSYSTGELGYYIRRLAEAGLVGMAATNANAMMAASSGGAKVFSTNPFAFGFPLEAGRAPVLIDQSSSATAYVNLLSAAAEGRSIPPGWAVDRDGNDTDDPAKALEGALLPAGGRKGANMALMVELLSAGLSGGAWSMDAADFISGRDCPSVGLTVIAILADPGGKGRVRRVVDQIGRLRKLGVYIPGLNRTWHPEPTVAVPRAVHEALLGFASAAIAR